MSLQISDKSLPQDVFPGPNLTNKDDQSEQVAAVLNLNLPASKAKTLLNVALIEVPAPKPYGKLAHEIVKPVTGWSYQELLPIRDMWREYIRRAIGKPVAQVTEGGNSLSLILSKCEFLGADVRVEKSKDPNMVGTRGIVVRETRKMFEIINSRSLHRRG